MAVTYYFKLLPTITDFFVLATTVLALNALKKALGSVDDLYRYHGMVYIFGFLCDL